MFGTEHPAVAGDLHNLAAVNHALGNLADAEPLYRRALGVHIWPANCAKQPGDPARRQRR